MYLTIFTRKQLWKKCIKNSKLKSNLNMKFLETKDDNNKKIKKVRFDKTIHLTLIPTRHEMNDFNDYYNSKKIFI